MQGLSCMSMPDLDRLSGKDRRRHAFIRPPAVVTAPVHVGQLKAPLDVYVCSSRGASGAFSLLVEEGRSTFGVMAGIWAKF